MSDLAEFWNEIEGLSKEERSERIQEKYGDNPEILEMLKQVLDNKDHNQDDLKRIYDSWKNQGQVRKKPTSENLTPSLLQVALNRRNVFVPTLKWCFYCYKTMVFLLRHKMVFQMRRHVFAVSIPSLIFPIFAIILNFMFLLFQMRHSFSSCYSYTYMQNLYFHEIITQHE